jgi:hypothetical protein
MLHPQIRSLTMNTNTIGKLFRSCQDKKCRPSVTQSQSSPLWATRILFCKHDKKMRKLYNCVVIIFKVIK